jgi:hypothetical protein
MPTDSNQHEFPAAEPIRAELRVRAGEITVAAEERDSAVVTITPYDGSDASRDAADETRVDFRDNRLRVDTPEVDGGIFRRTGRVRVDLRVPLDSMVAAHVGSADVHGTGRLGDVDVRTGSGDIYIGQTSGDLRVEGGSADIRADAIGGSLRVKTGSGDIRVTTVSGPVTVQAASGDVDIDDAAGDVRASTASGDIRLGSAGGDRVEIKAASGDVTIGVPTGTKVWLDLSTLSGTTASDLDAMGAPPEGGANLTLEVRTLSGDIRVHRTGQSAGRPAA